MRNALRDAARAAIKAAGAKGLSMAELGNAIQRNADQTNNCQWGLRRLGEIFHAGPLRYGRYFATRDWADAYEADLPRVIAAAKAESMRGRLARQRERHRADYLRRKAAMPPKPPKAAKKAKPAKFKQDDPAFIPPGVKVQKLPGFERFESPQRAKWDSMK